MKAAVVSDLIEVPRTALARLVAVAAHVSLGARAAFITPYPDSLARLALGDLDEELLEQFRPRLEDGNDD